MDRDLDTIRLLHHPEKKGCYWRGVGHDHPPGRTDAHGMACAECTTDDWVENYPCDVVRVLERYDDLAQQIDRLASCILTYHPDEPGRTGQSEGAIDVAIRLLSPTPTEPAS